MLNAGRCFKNGTLIMLSNGKTKPVESLTKKDAVIGLDGKPKKIIKIHEGSSQLYKVSQTNGDDYVVNGNHILVLKFTNVEGIYWDNSRERYKARYIQDLKIHDKSFPCDRDKYGDITDKTIETTYGYADNFLLCKSNEEGYNKGGDILEISVKDYLKLPANMKRILYGFKQEVNFKERSVDLDPYLLGLWLGDGNTTGPTITNIDKEIIDYIYDYANENNLRVSKKEPYWYYIAGAGKGNTFLNQLKHYNLIGNKHIPVDYLMNSREIRLKVLAGLMDSDGYMDKNMYEICQLSDQLAHDIVKLARSLGFRVGHTKRNKTCVKKDAPNVTKLYNIMLISGRNICDVPCLLKRKRAKACGKDVDFLITQINIEKDEVGDYTGFQIEGDGKFFGQDYTVLHNSTTSY